MKERIEKKGIPGEKVLIVPPWSHDSHVRFDPAGREQFRAAHNLSDKFVVMYSGNHSPCHPLETLLQAAERLTDRKDIVFCFVGGGSELPRIQERVCASRMRNVLCIPYQPIETLSASLSAADLHVIVMGEPFVGIVHPCKVYNILAASRSFLYIGPAESHISDIICKLGLQDLAQVSAHGDVDGVVANILRAMQNPSSLPALPPEAERSFAQDALVSNVVRALEEYYDKSGDCSYRVTADSNTQP
jgi:glycosyltransferase involved in cell wall biosynthesis